MEGSTSELSSSWPFGSPAGGVSVCGGPAGARGELKELRSGGGSGGGGPYEVCAGGSLLLLAGLLLEGKL